MRVMVARSGAFLLALGAAIALSGCELAIYSYGKAVDDSCAPWAAGCAAVVDAAGDGPVQAPRRSVAERAAIVEAAEAAPVRQCTRVPLACQGATLADVIVDQYVAMF